MACDGNCETCPLQCAGSKLKANLDAVMASPNKPNQPNQQEESMATVTSTSGCGAPKDIDNVKAAADIQRLTEENERLQKEIERLGGSTPLCTGIKTLVYAIGVLAFAAIIVSVYSVSRTSKYGDVITTANKTAEEAQKLAGDAIRKAEDAEDRSNKNYDYLRDMKRDLKQELLQR